MITKEQILNMPAGAEMNALIAENLFGFRPISAEQVEVLKAVQAIFPNHLDGQGLFWDKDNQLSWVGDWSGDSYGSYQSMFNVIRFMKEQGWFYKLSDLVMSDDHVAHFFAPDRDDAWAEAPTIQLAVCRAALIGHLSLQPESKF